MNDLLAEDGEPSKVGLVFALAWTAAIAMWVFGGLHFTLGPLDYVVPRLEMGTLTSILTLATSGLIARKVVTKRDGDAETKT